MRYVPTDASTPAAERASERAIQRVNAAAPPAAAVRRAVHDLRVATERWDAAHPAWARRWGRGGAAPASLPRDRVVGAASDSASDPASDPAFDPASDPLAAVLAQLRAATTRYVYGLRAGGARPEQMLVAVKAFVREAMAAEGWDDHEAVQALTDAVVRWSIAAYYDG